MHIKTKLMDEATLQRTLMRIAHEILEKNKDTEKLCLIGIQRRGETLAHIICNNIQKIEGIKIPCGSLNIKFYRDDLSHVDANPILLCNDLPFSVHDQKVVIIDDVLYTGRTVRAAIEGIFDLGRPQAIQLAILIDRGHRELPLKADFVGKSIPTTQNETVAVCLAPYDEETGVFLYDND